VVCSMKSRFIAIPFASAAVPRASNDRDGVPTNRHALVSAAEFSNFRIFEFSNFLSIGGKRVVEEFVCRSFVETRADRTGRVYRYSWRSGRSVYPPTNYSLLFILFTHVARASVPAVCPHRRAEETRASERGMDSGSGAAINQNSISTF